MLITKTSFLSGKVYTADLPVTQEEINRWKVGGEKIQDVFPHLTPNQREFLLTGSTQEEWDMLDTNEEDE